MGAAPIVLVPGWWLGAWAWDDVVEALRAGGHHVTALTLPGLESADADRSNVTLDDHVDAICEAVTSADAPVVLAVHSGAGVPGYGASDRVADRIAAMVYVDSAPGTGPMDADAEGDLPMPTWEKLAEDGENIDGISDEQKEAVYARSASQPGGVLRQGLQPSNEARLDLPTTIICTAFPSDEVKKYIDEDYPWMNGLKDLRNVDYVDLPTSHWPMFSKPRETAEILGEIATKHGS